MPYVVHSSIFVASFFTLPVRIFFLTIFLFTFKLQNGGVLYNLKGSIDVFGSVFEYNTAGLNGGALFFDRGDGIISDCKFLGNTAEQEGDFGGGGAISVYRASLDIQDTVFSGNTGENGFDIFIEEDGDPATGAADVDCKRKVIFCNGLDGIVKLADDVTEFANTNCQEAGEVGTPEFSSVSIA